MYFRIRVDVSFMLILVTFTLNTVADLDITDVSLKIYQGDSVGVSRNFFLSDNLVVHAGLYIENDLLSQSWVPAGVDWTAHRPVLVATNRSWSHSYGKFTHNNLTESLQWEIDIPRDLLTTDNTYTLSKEQWTIDVSITIGDAILSANATLLDIQSEPLLQWDMGVPIAVPDPAGIVSGTEWYTTVSPCAPDVILTASQTHLDGLLTVVVSYSAFVNETSQWYTIDLCSLATDCNPGTLWDVALTNRHLVILTSRGLFVSNDLTSTVQHNVTDDRQQVHFLPATVLNIEWSKLQNTSTEPFRRGHLKYTEHCLFRMHDPILDDLLMAVLTDITDHAVVVHSSGDLTEWTVSPGTSPHVILDAAYHVHRDLLVLLTQRENQHRVHVRDFTGTHDLAEFEFPDDVNIMGLLVHPLSHALFAYGDGIWQADEGQFFFEKMYTGALEEHIDSLIFGYSDYSILAQSSSGSFLCGKLGVPRFLPMNKTGLTSVISSFIDYTGAMVQFGTRNETAYATELLSVENTDQFQSAESTHPLVYHAISARRAKLYEYCTLVPCTAPLFSGHNTGQVVTLRSGGAAIIETVDNYADNVNFISQLTVLILQSFESENKTLRFDAENESYAIVSTLDTDTDPWTTSDMYKTLHVPYESSLVITDIINTTHVLAKSVFTLHTHGTATVNIYDFAGNQQGAATWGVREDECRHELAPQGGLQQLYELDIRDSLTIQTYTKVSSPLTLFDRQHTFMYVSAPFLFFSRNTINKLNFENLEMTSTKFMKKNTRKGITSYRLSVPHSSLLCARPSIVVTVYAGCPCRKRLVHWLPTPLTTQELEATTDTDEPLMVTLYPNYRPPSKYGVGIPTSENIYSADPSKPMPHNRFKISQHSGRYKQCAGKTSRAGCGCTDTMRYSSDAVMSDCKEKVYRLFHPGVLFPNFTVEQPGRAARLLATHTDLVTVWELNQRLPEFKRVNMSGLLEAVMGDDSLGDTANWYTPGGLKIIMVKSGLYHFRAEIPRGYSFCNLYAEFQVFVDSTPIAYPLHHIIRFTMALLIGGLFFVVYLWYLSTHHVHRYRPTGPQCQDMADMVNMDGSFRPSSFQRVLAEALPADC